MLQQLSDVDARVVWLTLIILDACVKNCPDLFVMRIASSDFMTAITKIVKKRWMKKKERVQKRHSVQKLVWIIGSFNYS